VSDALSPSDQLLVDAVRSGDPVAWEQLVTGFHGRLLAFARRQLPQPADAEDAVQEAFLSLLSSLTAFRGDVSLETWLFQLLRRRIADHYRRSSRAAGRPQPPLPGPDTADPMRSGDAVRSPVGTNAVDWSASWYVRRSEQQTLDQQALSAAVMAVARVLRDQRKFRDLKVFDLLFLAQFRNQDIAMELDLEETAVAVLRHRMIQRLGGQLNAAHFGSGGSETDSALSDGLLAQVWDEVRPSCPRRSTLGKYLLGTLDDAWTDYVTFHATRLPCRYCEASLDDLAREIDAGTAISADPLRQRLLESTVGFLTRPPVPSGRPQ